MRPETLNNLHHLKKHLSLAFFVFTAAPDREYDDAKFKSRFATSFM